MCTEISTPYPVCMQGTAITRKHTCTEAALVCLSATSAAQLSQAFKAVVYERQQGAQPIRLLLLVAGEEQGRPHHSDHLLDQA